MGYQSQVKKDSLGATYSQEEVHHWRPPCSCGVELNEALEGEESISRTEAKGEVHSWRPPCSCGISLDEVVE